MGFSSLLPEVNQAIEFRGGDKIETGVWEARLGFVVVGFVFSERESM